MPQVKKRHLRNSKPGKKDIRILLLKPLPVLRKILIVLSSLWTLDIKYGHPFGLLILSRECSGSSLRRINTMDTFPTEESCIRIMFSLAQLVNESWEGISHLSTSDKKYTQMLTLPSSSKLLIFILMQKLPIEPWVRQLHVRSYQLFLWRPLKNSKIFYGRCTTAPLQTNFCQIVGKAVIEVSIFLRVYSTIPIVSEFFRAPV